jgi:septal ring factor EnvC (AmiA/AmiB activator)
MQGKVDGKDRELREAWQKAQELQRVIRNQETLIYSIPLELREKLMNKHKTDKERKHTR